MTRRGLHVLGATYDDLEQEARKVASHVSPWLWILSIGGFTMALMNRYQIANAVGGSMFGSFAKLRAALRGRKAS